MGNNTITELGSEEIVQLLVANLAECNMLVTALSKQSVVDKEDLRKIKNNLMFTRSKARNLSKSLQEMKKPVNAFRLST